MAQVRTNKTAFNSSIETALGTAGNSWLRVEVNTISELGAINEKVMRNPISTDRQRRKGAIVGKTSGFAFEADATLAHLEAYLPAFMFAEYAEPGTTGTAQFVVTAAVDGGGGVDSFTVTAIPAVEVWQFATPSTFVDETSGFNDSTDANFTPFPASETDELDYCAFGLATQFNELVFDDTGGTQGVGGSVAWEYWNGSAWTAVSGLTDGTVGFTNALADGKTVTFTLPTDWATTTINSGATLYFVRARITDVYGTNPILDQGWIGAQGALVANELVYSRGLNTAANNALWVVNGATSTPTSIKVPTNSLTAEASPPANAEIEVAGYQGASGDIEFDASGDLTSTVVDFTTWRLSVGQYIKLGGTATDTAFATTAYNDYARVDVIAANKLTLSKRGWTVGAADNGSDKTIQVFYGRFLRQYDVDDAKFIERSYTFEAKLDNLLPGPADHYSYPKGNYAGQVDIAFPLKGKVTLAVQMIGTDTEDPTTTRKTGASTALAPTKTALLTTAGTIWKRLRITETDETGVLSDLKQGTLRINNNVTREFAQGPGQTGAKFMNYGNHHPDFEGSYLFADKAAVTAITADRTMTGDFGLENADGAIFFDFPSIDLTGGGIGLPVNETVTITSPAESFKQTTGVNQYSMSVSLFPHIPR